MPFSELHEVTYYYCVFKIDRLYDWKKSPDTDVAVTLKKQKKNTKDEFEERAKAIIVEFAKQVGWNVQDSLVKKKTVIMKVVGGCWGCLVWVFSFHKTNCNIKKTVASLLTCWCLPLVD